MAQFLTTNVSEIQQQKKILELILSNSQLPLFHSNSSTTISLLSHTEIRFYLQGHGRIYPPASELICLEMRLIFDLC